MGLYKVGDIVIYDYNNGNGWGFIMYCEGVECFSNVVFVKFLNKMGIDMFKIYLDKFGFGKKIGIVLFNEISGKILYNYLIEKVIIVFG